MEELTMLVQLAGGDLETAHRLRDAGFRNAREVARAEVRELREHSGLSAAASRQLVRAAKEILAPARGRKKNTRRQRSGLRGLPSALSSGGATSDVEREVPLPTSVPVVGQPGADQGVSRVETSALLDEAVDEDGTQSFWRFG